MAFLKVDDSSNVNPGDPAAVTADEIVEAGFDRSEQRVPMTRLRARIAERLVEAQHTAAMLTTFNEVDLTEVMTNKNRPEGWAWRLGSFELTPRGDKYVLITQDMDHFLGGHICRPEGDKGPDDEALAIVGGATTAFLDAYLKEDVAAKRFIKSNAVNELSNGRAEMKSR